MSKWATISRWAHLGWNGPERLVACCLFLVAGSAIAQQPASMRLVWADEFAYTGAPDTSKWSYDVGDGCPTMCGWGNNELQHYTAHRLENARVENGVLIVEAHQEPTGNRAYSSARLVSKAKGDWRYGRIEARARLPRGTGVWPAIWMLPTEWAYGHWPRSGEIDIMEFVGYMPDSIFGTIHTQRFNHIAGTQVTKGIYAPTVSDDFHRYAVDWRPDRIDFYFDDVRYLTFVNPGDGPDAWPFDKAFHLILNVAVGGNWGGRKGIDNSIWPQQMQIDYVRVYQSNETR